MGDQRCRHRRRVKITIQERKAMTGIVDFQHTGEWSLLDPMPAELLASGQPELRGVELFSAPEDGVSVGLWSATPFVTAGGPYPVDEFMVLLEGCVIIRLPDGRSQTVRAGDSFFIPKGLDCKWDQPETVRKIYVIFENGVVDPSATVPLKIDPEAVLAHSPGPSPAILIGAEPRHSAKLSYVDASGQFSVGVWATTPYSRMPVTFSRHELMHLLVGEVTLTAAGAAPRTYRAGDTFFVKRGCVVDWVSTCDVRKIHCSVVPKVAS
jgi:uncharacterized cupin superfamily protein